MGNQRAYLGERRLGAIMFTDVVGFSSISSLDEGKALKILGEHRRVLESVFPKYGGVVVKTIGDGFLVEFASAVEAVNCALDAQKEMAAFNAGRKADEKVMIRIGIHLGDVIHSGGDILGDAVNVAARLQPLAEPGGICLTRQVADQVQRKIGSRMVSMGVRELKNIRYPVEVFKVDISQGAAGSGESLLDSKRLAVLPFANMSPDPNDRYFADGMTEELISTVSKISELQVISRTSVMRYRDTPAQISQIGQELSVGSVLEGSVRKAGNKVRITAQLIAVDGDRHVWSQSYDRDLTDVFAIQADIAEQVASSLKVQLLSREKQSIRKEATSSYEAYTLYLKGRYYLNERTEEGARKALRYFEEATKVDPKFAVAFSGIADSYAILSDYGWMKPSEALALAKSNAIKALDLDDLLAEAHASLGLVLSNYAFDLAGSERELKHAIQLKPNYALAHHWYGIAMFFMRRHDEADAAFKRALALDPYSRIYNLVNANELLIWGKYDEALKRYGEMIDANPDFPALRYWRSTCYLLLGRFDDAIEEARKFVEMEGGSWASIYSNLHLAWVCAATGSRSEAEGLLARAIGESEKTFASPTGIGWAKLTLGQKDEGYAWLRRALQERDPSLLYFNGFPWTKEFRADPRWKAIEARMGFRSAPD